MIDDLTRRVLNAGGMGAIVFDSDLFPLEIEDISKRILERAGSFIPGGDLLTLFPELVGSEEIISAVLRGDSPSFSLDYINRNASCGRLLYLNITVIRGREEKEGILLLTDVTREAEPVQENNQQRYDYLLLKRAAEYSGRGLSGKILGTSLSMEKVRKTIEQLAGVPGTTILILGESGTGKNLAAKAIHDSSFPSGAPFIDINCGALPENLIEAELFGVERGAYTHAVETRKGLIEAAHGGTIFLDEIGELPLNLQVKLLSVLENKVIRRLGSNRNIGVAVRVIAATNRDLFREVAEKRFREDLFYRLNVVSFQMPPLRELKEDSLQLVEYFLKVFNVAFNKKVKGLTDAARKAIKDYQWPGNVRELSNCIERAMIFAEGELIHREQLVFFQPQELSEAGKWEVPPEGVVLEEVERRLIGSALERAGNNKSKAAGLLGLTRDTLRYRLEKYGIR